MRKPKNIGGGDPFALTGSAVGISLERAFKTSGLASVEISVRQLLGEMRRASEMFVSQDGKVWLATVKA